MAEQLPDEALRYLRRLRGCLDILGTDERDETVREVQAHLRDTYASGGTNPLADLGSPEEYAEQFIVEHQLSSAVSKGEPIGMMRALLLSARGAFLVVPVVVPLSLAYLSGVLAVVMGMIKPFMPDSVGVFVRDGHLVAIGMVAKTDGLDEVLGWWGIPTFLVVGAGTVWLAHRGLRTVAKWRLARFR